MGRTTIKPIFVEKPKYTGKRPDYYLITNYYGKQIRVNTKERALEIASASKRINAKKNASYRLYLKNKKKICS